MPQASDELRNAMQQHFGSPTDDAGPSDYLKRAGYQLRQDWTWRAKEHVTCLRDMTRLEFECLMFLSHEHDYGGLTDDSGLSFN